MAGVLDSPVEYRARVSDMADADRPRERLERLGPQALKTEELLAILLGTGTAREDVLAMAERMLREQGGLRGLAASDISALRRIHGMGPAKATTIAAAFELGRRLAREGADVRPQVTSPEDIVALLHQEMQLLQQEELRVLVLDVKNRVLAHRTLYRGTVSSAGGRVAELFREAVARGAVKIAIAHNHPSGDPAPSPDDIEFTRAVAEAGDLMEIPLVDHLIFGHGDGRWVSMRRQRLGFDE